MRSTVRVLRGRCAGQLGTIAGTLEDRATRGITKAIVYLPSGVDFLPTDRLEPVAQLSLFAETKNPPPA